MPDAGQAAGGHAGRLVGPGQRLDEADPLAVGEQRQSSLGPLADAALGHVEDPPQVDRVGRVGQDPEVGQRVLDLAPLVEPRAADHLVGQLGPDEDLFQGPGLGVGPVEDGDVAGSHAGLAAQPADLLGDERRLVVLVVRDVPDDRLAAATGGPQVLGPPGRVLGDQGVGRRQDGLRGAVVLLQQNGFRVGVVDLELRDVADRGAAEGVDRLVCVADDDQLARRDIRRTGSGLVADQLADQDVLRVVGVLVLVDHHVAEPAAVVIRDLRESLQDVDRRHDQVVEVERVGLAQPALVHRVGLGQHPLGVVALADPAGEGLLVDQFVLEVGDLGAEAARRVALGVQVELAQDQGHQPLGVGRVVDRERGFEPDAAGLAAQDPHAGGVEGRHPHPVGPRPDQADDPLAHLAGGLVGERDGQDLARAHVAGGQQVGDPVGQHPGLAGAGAGHDEQRAALVDDGLALLRVEPLEQLLRVALGRRRWLGGRADLAAASGSRARRAAGRGDGRRGCSLPAQPTGRVRRPSAPVGSDYSSRVATIPDSEVERALVVVAHPDDVDFGASGTVATWVDAGIAVTYLLCTRGDAGGFDDTPRSRDARPA